MGAGGDEGGWDVDAAEAPEAYVEYLEQNSESALMRRTVEQRLRTLGVSGSRRVLDVGCGIGTHARMVAAGAPAGAQIIGVDRSQAMVRSAAERAAGARYVRADAHHLPFPTASFDLGWVERTLVHVDAPLVALRELRRVLEPAGRAVIAEADYTGVLLDCDDEALWHQLHTHWLQRQRQPSIGRRLPKLLREAGFEQVELHPELRTFDGVAWVDRALGLRRRSEELVTAGKLEPARARAFWHDLESRDSAGCFFMAIPFVVAVASDRRG